MIICEPSNGASVTLIANFSYSAGNIETSCVIFTENSIVRTMSWIDIASNAVFYFSVAVCTSSFLFILRRRCIFLRNLCIVCLHDGQRFIEIRIVTRCEYFITISHLLVDENNLVMQI